MSTKWEINKAVRASDLPAPSRLIMLTLSDAADVDTAEIPEQFTPSIRELADETGLDKATVKRHLTLLEERGWIQRDRPDLDKARRDGERTRYRLLNPAGVGAESANHGAQDAYPHGAESAYVGAQSAKAMAQSAPSHGARSAKGRRTVRHIVGEPDLFQITPDLLPDHSSSAAPPKRAPTKPKPPSDPTKHPDFMAWYAAYPRAAARPDAYRAYLKATEKITVAELLAKTTAYAAAERARGTEQRFLPHPATWLNREGWNDRLPEAARAAPSTNGHQPYRNPTDNAIYEAPL